MKKFYLLPVVLFTLCFFAAPITGQANEKTNAPILSVDGSGSAQTQPDRATITIGVTSYSENAQQAQEENAARATAIQTALSELGIPSKDIQTRNYSFRTVYENTKNHTNEITGYNVDNNITVVLDNIGLIGKTVDTALQSGANRINSLGFSSRNTDKVRQEALQAAVKDARNKADVIAAALGKNITGIQAISESTSSLQERDFNSLMLAKSSATTPISPGSLELSANIHIDFILNN